MRLFVRTLTAALTLALALPLALTLPTPVTAQEPDPASFIINFDKSLSYLANFGVIHAFMGATECGNLDPTQDDWTIVVGGPATPAACNQGWRVINLIPDQNGLIADAPIFMPGETLTLTTLAGYAFFDSAPEPPFFIRTDPDASEPTQTDLAALSSLTAYVGGVACGTADPPALEDGFLYIAVGTLGTPDACREIGSEIALVNAADGTQLAVHFSVQVGFNVLTNLTLDTEQPAPFTIEFDEQLDLYFYGTMQAVVGPTVCGSVDFAANERTLVVGGPGTPAECNQAWRAVTLVPGNNHAPLGNDLILMPGETVTVTGLTPFPSILGPDLPPFWIEVRSNGQSITEADLIDLQPLTAYIGDMACGSSASAASEPTIFSIPVGAAGTPEVCRQAGAEIFLVDGNGIRLAVRPSIGPGPYYSLTNLTPDPVGRGIPGPGSAGNVGLAHTPTSSHTIELLLAAVALTILARRLTARR